LELIVGVRFPGVEIKISERQELLCRSPNVMLGYWNNRKATAETIDEEGWFYTGDKVKIESDHIFITGRLKEIIVLANGEAILIPPQSLSISGSHRVDRLKVTNRTGTDHCKEVSEAIDDYRIPLLEQLSHQLP
jgi:long-chain acyl-CoA synthetase